MNKSWNQRGLQAAALCIVSVFVACSNPIIAQEPAPQSPVAEVADIAVADDVLSKQYRLAMIIDFDSPIFAAQHSYLNNRLDRAKRQGVDLIIIRLTSPGGLLEESLELSRRLSAIDWATTIAYVPREAISGGAIIALGCDRIYMHPRALIGDAGPIVMGIDGMFKHAEEKTVSYLTRALREIAEAKHRPGALAEAMADRALKVHLATDKNTGAEEFLSDKQLADPAIADRFNLGPSVLESGDNRFLTVTGARAVELRLAEKTFESETELMSALMIENQVQTRMNWLDSTVFLLNRPWLTGLLLFIALVALYIELAAPGISFAGLTSLACFGIFFWSHALGGTSGWLEVLVFILGVTCILVELFLIPGTGIFGLSGVLFVLLSLIMATQDFLVPNSKIQWAQFQTNSLVVVGSVAIVGLLFVVQLIFFDSLPGLKQFQLSAPTVDNVPTTNFDSPAPSQATPTLPQEGERGVAESVLRPSGKVLFGPHLVDVVTEGDYLDPGTPVEVIRREGNRIIVRKV